MSVFQNNATSGLSLTKVATFSSASNNPSWVGLADFTGDAVPDIVVGSFGKGSGESIGGNGVNIFQGNADGNGKGNFTYGASPITTLRPVIQFIPTALAVADFDGNGKMDIAAAVPSVPPDFNQPNQNATVYVFEGTGGGGFASTYSEYDSGGVLPVNIQAADINGDNKPDLILANAGDPNDNPEFKGNSVGLIENSSSIGNVSFGFTNTLTANAYGTFAVAVADFNVDGKAGHRGRQLRRPAGWARRRSSPSSWATGPAGSARTPPSRTAGTSPPPTWAAGSTWRSATSTRTAART